MSFESVADKYDQWYESPEGRYMDAEENRLFMMLVRPRPGQTIAELGCGTGHNIRFFQKIGLRTAGIEPSPAMLAVATAKCGPEANLCAGDACALTYQDSEFDIVAIITALEFMPDPEGALREALRVSRGVVFLGVLNRLSIMGVSRKIQSLFRKNIYSEARFLSIGDIRRMVKKVAPEVEIEWASALCLPFGWHHVFQGLDHFLGGRKNPFGGYLGVRLTKPGAAKNGAA